MHVIYDVRAVTSATRLVERIRPMINSMRCFPIAGSRWALPHNSAHVRNLNLRQLRATPDAYSEPVMDEALVKHRTNVERLPWLVMQCVFGSSTARAV